MKDKVLEQLEYNLEIVKHDEYLREHYKHLIKEYKEEKDRVDTLRKACKQIFTVEASLKDTRQGNAIGYYLLRMSNSDLVVVRPRIINFIKREMFKDCAYHNGILKAKKSVNVVSQHMRLDGRPTSITKIKIDADFINSIKNNNIAVVMKSYSIAEIDYNSAKEREAVKFIIKEIAKNKYGTAFREMLSEINRYTNEYTFVKIIDGDEIIYASTAVGYNLDKTIKKHSVVLTDKEVKLLGMNLNIVCTVTNKPMLEVVGSEYHRQLYKRYGTIEIAGENLELNIGVRDRSYRAEIRVSYLISSLLMLLR